MTGSEVTPIVNKAWLETPNDWNCPVCKRHKTELIRMGKNCKSFGSLEDHHDHISNYIKDNARKFKDEHIQVNDITGKKGSFLKHKLSPFFERFNRTLICMDCNAADGAAKDIVTNVCTYFSFSPQEIAKFIIPIPNKSHKIQSDLAAELYENLRDIHEYRKDFIDVLLDRVFLNGRHWGEIPVGPSRAHYRTLSKIVTPDENIVPGNWDTLWKLRDNNLGLSKSDKIKEKKERKKRRKEYNKTHTNKLINQGEIWTKEDNLKLLKAVKNGVETFQIACEFGRTEYAIIRHLEILEKG